MLEAFADELSAGQQQKLAISLALSQEADLYVIDEPLANLDPESRDTAINLILERTKEKTLVLVMHGSEEYHKLFDRVIRIDVPQPGLELIARAERHLTLSSQRNIAPREKTSRRMPGIVNQR